MSNSVIVRPDENGNNPTFNQGGVDQTQAYKSFTFQSGATATGNGTVADVTGYDVLTLQTTISATATVSYEVSSDNSNWYSIFGLNPNSVANQSVSTTVGGMARFNVTGLRYFRARISAYTSGTVDVIGVATRGSFQIPNVTSNYGSADGNTASPYLLGTGSYLLGFNGTTWDRVRTVNTGQIKATLYNSTGTEPTITSLSSLGDGATLSSNGLAQYGLNYLYNGASYDRFRNNLVGTGLASAARTSTTTSSDFTNYNHRGIVLSLNVTVASGAGGLQVQIQAKDTIALAYKAINTAPTAITATGQYIYMIYPGIDTVSNNNAQNVSQVLPQIFRISVTHGDSSSYTYSVNYHMIL